MLPIVSDILEDPGCMRLDVKKTLQYSIHSFVVKKWLASWLKYSKAIVTNKDCFSFQIPHF